MCFMNTKYLLIVCLALSRIDSFGHDQNVHRAITVNAAASAYAHSPAYVSFINTVSSDGVALKDSTKSLSDGSYDEDNKDVDDSGNKDVGGKRSLNHFYDPLDQTYGKR